jgi:hypothetical protein
VPEGVNSHKPQEPGARSFFMCREPIVVMTEETRNLFDRGGGVAPCRATDRFTELPMGQAALEFASIRHAGQYREVDRAPFITHPTEVGELLQADGQPDQVIAAGLLHDVLEKTATISAELRHRFGPRVAQLVETVSVDQSIRDHDGRKRGFRPAHAAGRRAGRAGIWPIPSAISGMACSSDSSGGNRG